MMDWSGWGAAGSLALMVVMLLLAVLAVAGLVLLFRPVFGGQSRATPVAADGQATDSGSALRTIEERYVRGEMDPEEFLARRRKLIGKLR